MGKNLKEVEASKVHNPYPIVFHKLFSEDLWATMNPGSFMVSLFQCLASVDLPSLSPVWDGDYALSVLGIQVSQRLSINHTAGSGKTCSAVLLLSLLPWLLLVILLQSPHSPGFNQELGHFPVV